LLFILLIWKCFSTKTKAEKIFGQAHFANAVEIQKAGLFAEQRRIKFRVAKITPIKIGQFCYAI
jgi:type IV secretory pathway TraG/TraD family ATPase VirD4